MIRRGNFSRRIALNSRRFSGIKNIDGCGAKAPIEKVSYSAGATFALVTEQIGEQKWTRYPAAWQWVEKQCSERHRWVEEAFTVRWRDAIEALGLCLSQPRFRARIQQALMYCADCSLWAQRNQEARPAFLGWGFSRVLKESRFWGELQNDMVAAHGMDWEELYVSYPCFVDRIPTWTGVRSSPCIARRGCSR